MARISELEYRDLARKTGIPFPETRPARPLFRSKAEFAWSQRLEARRLQGEIDRWCYEGITLKLGADCRYTPDFFAVFRDGRLELHEVKGGYIRPDGLVKLRAAATRFPEFRFVLCQLVKTRWEIEEVRRA